MPETHVRASGSTKQAVDEFFATERRNFEKIWKATLGLSEDDDLAPYVYQEYPKALHGAEGEIKVNTPEEERAKLREGYFATPQEAEAAALSYLSAEEAEEIAVQPESKSDQARRAAQARWAKKTT